MIRRLRAGREGHGQVGPVVVLIGQLAGVEADGVKVEPSVCILVSGIRCAVSPKS